MTRLNEQFMEAFADGGGAPRLNSIGYTFAKQEQGSDVVSLSFNPYMEPGISTLGTLKAGLLKGGTKLNAQRTGFERGGLYTGKEGLHLEIDDQYGDRKYFIADTDHEEITVTNWDPNADTEDWDGNVGGSFGPYEVVSIDDAEVVRNIVASMIESAKQAVETQAQAV